MANLRASLFIGFLGFLPACASNLPHAYGEVPAGVKGAERLGCVVLTYTEQKRQDKAPPKNQSRSKEREVCGELFSKAGDAKKGFQVVSGEKAWEAILPGAKADKFPDSVDGLLEMRAGQGLAGSDLRYAAAVEVTTTESKGGASMEPGGGGSGGGGILALGMENYNFETTASKVFFIDLAENRRISSIDSYRTDKDGWFVGGGCCVAPPFVIPFVTPPIPVNADTRAKTLEAIRDKIGEGFKQ